MSATEETIGATTPGSEKIVLKSSDGAVFEMKKGEAMLSGMLKNMIDDGCFQGAIPVQAVAGKTLAKVLEYCTKHHKAASASGGGYGGDDSLKSWDTEFMGGCSQETVFDLVMAANFLDINGLLDLTCQTVADMITKARTPEGVRQFFNIENDFTPEEEQQIRRDNSWAFDQD